MRYYGFLSNRKRGTLLSKVYNLLEIAGCKKKPKKLWLAELLIKELLQTDQIYRNVFYVTKDYFFIDVRLTKQAMNFLSERMYKNKKPIVTNPNL